MRNIRWILCALALSVPLSAAVAESGGSNPIGAPALRAVAAGQAGRPSGLDATFGIDVGPRGRVYVVLALRSQILVLDRHTGREIDRIGPERGVDGPDDIEVGADGTLYWTSPLVGTISALFPDGTFRSQFVAPGLNPITIRDDGRVYVAAAFDARGLFEIDPLLLTPPRVLIPDITGLNGFDFGPDGRLYSPDTGTGGVVRIDVDATPPTVEQVAAPGTFPFPGAVSFDETGVLHVADAAFGQVFRLDPETGARELRLDIEGTIDNLAFDQDGVLYATALADGQILRQFPFARGSTLPLPLGPRGRAGIIGPAGLAVDDQGAVFAADLFSLRRLARGWPRDLATFYDRFFDGDFRPLSVDFDAGRLLSTTLGGIVRTLDADTGTVLDERLFLGPSNAIFVADDIVVAQLLARNVVRGDGSVVLDGLLVPLGLAPGEDSVFVGDFAAGTIFEAPTDGRPARVVAAGLAGPEGIARFEDWLIVAETSADRISAIDIESGERTTLLEVDLDDETIAGVTGVPPFGVPNGLAVDGRRRLLYVSSDRTNQVLAYRLFER